MVKKTKKEVDQPVVQGPGPSFRLHKTYKRRLALTKDPAVRAHLKRMFISAQLAEQQASVLKQKGYLEMFKGGV